MKCARCGLETPPGSVHVSEAGCIEALLHALANARICSECRTEVPVVVHPGCITRLVGKRAADLGLGAIERKALDALSDLWNKPRGDPQKWKP